MSRLQSLVPGVRVSKEPNALTEILIDARVVPAEIDNCPRLKAVILPFAGVPAAVLQTMRDRPGVSLHNLHHNAPDTAETAVALLLAAAKNLIKLDQDLRKNDWSGRYAPSNSRLLAGRTALILGYGEIGRRIGRILEAMAMKVIGVNRSNFAQLHEYLPKAEVLIVTLPHTAATSGLIGAHELQLLPDRAIVVNVARGQIIDEEAFYRALKSGQLHSAGSDVWYQYPKEENSAVPTHSSAPASAKNTPPSKFPFGELPNMVLSPHRGGANSTTEENRMIALAELLTDAIDGRPMRNKVDLDRGY